MVVTFFAQLPTHIWVYVPNRSLVDKNLKEVEEGVDIGVASRATILTTWGIE